MIFFTVSIYARHGLWVCICMCAYMGLHVWVCMCHELPIKDAFHSIKTTKNRLNHLTSFIHYSSTIAFVSMKELIDSILVLCVVRIVCSCHHHHRIVIIFFSFLLFQLFFFSTFISMCQSDYNFSLNITFIEYHTLQTTRTHVNNMQTNHKARQGHKETKSKKKRRIKNTTDKHTHIRQY